MNKNYNSDLVRVLEYTEDAIISKSLDGTIQSWNKGSERMFGYTSKEMIGKNISLLIPPESINDDKNHLSRISDTKNFHRYETTRITKNGEQLFVSLIVDDIKDQTGTIIGTYEVARDITSQKKSEDELIEAIKELAFQNAEKENRANELIIANKELTFQNTEKEKRAAELSIANKELAFLNKQQQALFASIVNSSEDAMLSKTLDSIITSWNSGAEKIFGYSADEIIGKNVLTLFPPQLKHEEADIIKKIKSGQILNQYQTRRIRKDGTTFHVSLTASPIRNFEGNIIGASNVLRDITEQKKAEENIKNNERQLNVIYNTVSDSFFMLSIEDQNRFKFISVNSTFLKTTGLNEEQIIGQYVHNVIPMPSLQMVLEKYNEAITGRSSVSWEETSVYPSGTKTGFVTVSPVIDEKNNCTMLVGSVHDITDRKIAEEKIIESENRMRLVTSSAAMGIWYWDNKNDVMVWDKKMYQIYDINESQLGSVYEGWLSRLHPEDKDRVNEVMQTAIADKIREYSSEFRIIWDDLSVHYIKGTGITEYDENGNVIQMMGVNWDITAEKEKEQHLKLLESVIINTTDSVLITEAEPFDEPGPRILYVNDAFTKMTGYTAEEVIGKTPRILQGPKSDRAELKRLSEAIRRWESCEITTINYKKNGEEFWINFTLTPVADEKGWFTHWIAIERDVTAQIKYITTLESQNIKLREIAWSQSHIVRAPLARMMGIVSMLSDFKMDSSEYEEWVKHFNDSASELESIIKDIVGNAETNTLK